MEPGRIKLDDPDDEVLPASRPRRRAAAMLGCLTLVLVLAVLIWFVASNTKTLENPGLFGP